MCECRSDLEMLSGEHPPGLTVLVCEKCPRDCPTGWQRALPAWWPQLLASYSALGYSWECRVILDADLGSILSSLFGTLDMVLPFSCRTVSSSVKWGVGVSDLRGHYVSQIHIKCTGKGQVTGSAAQGTAPPTITRWSPRSPHQREKETRFSPGGLSTYTVERNFRHKDTLRKARVYSGKQATEQACTQEEEKGRGLRPGALLGSWVPPFKGNCKQ